MFSNSNEGKAKEIHLDPPPLDGYDDQPLDGYDDQPLDGYDYQPLDGYDDHNDHNDHDHDNHDNHDDHDDHVPATIDGKSYNSDFGSGYSEAGLDDIASLSSEDDGYRGGFSATGSLDDQSSIIDDEFAHGVSSNSNNSESHRSTPAETSRSFAWLRKVVPGASGASTSPTSPKALCVICNKQPAYNDGHRIFPTCGNTCAAKLEAGRNTDVSSRIKNKTHPPIHTSQRSAYTIPLNGHHNAKASVIRMCEVCRVRPRYQKIFPTCGLTCAAKLQRPGSVEMCELCKKKPKVVINGRKYPHCGRNCRDKAKSGSAKIPTTSTIPELASCTSCLLCRKADRIGIACDFCSDQCRRFVDKRAPFLLEVPRGHMSFKDVANFFSFSWGYPQSACPIVKKVYMVNLKPSFGPKYDSYRSKVSRRITFFKEKGNERRVWLGMTRTCCLGDSGNAVPCESLKCLLCGLVRSSLSQEIAQRGITTSSSLSKAVELSNSVQKGRRLRVVLLANAIFGREVKKGIRELVLPLPPQGFDSVRLVERCSAGGKIDRGESLVFDGDAIRPLYLIYY